MSMDEAGPRGPDMAGAGDAAAGLSPAQHRPASPGPAALVDPFGRVIRYLRVSVTDRCDFRCVYCMSEGTRFLPKADLLTLEDLDRVCSAFVRLGTRKLRITGGEPLVRRNILHLFRRLGRHLDSGALDELTLTTNARRLADFAAPLHQAGVRRVNVSLDSLDRDRFAAITRNGPFDRVMAGIDAADGAGLAVKINMVVLKGVNDGEVDRMIAWCGDRGFDLTLIEIMPMGDIGNEQRLDQYLPLSAVEDDLSRRWTLQAIPHRSGGPARYVRVAETGGRLGFITPLSHNFCEGCNRVRLTCTGTLYMCLGQDDAADLRAPLRAGAADAALDGAIRAAIARKPRGHDFVAGRSGAPSVSRPMTVTGG
jgi:cyclic pyranopterin phosphate synthase